MIQDNTMNKEAAAADEVCASCGTAAVDDVKLKDCDGGCDLVKYCSDGCQNIQREQHEEECKKRKDELRDRDLFTPPEGTHLGECPICCLPLSIDLKASILMSCCSKSICDGCDYANQKRESEAGLEPRCAFCREPAPRSGEKSDKLVMKRIKKNDPVAMRHMGNKRGSEGDYKAAIKYFTKAAELGDAVAHYQLCTMYHHGDGVKKDNEKAIYHAEEAAIAGHPGARHNLGCEEWRNGRYERARKHFIIAANLGFHDSLKCLKELFANGHASKEDYADALRAFQTAVDATKSSERDEAEKSVKNGETTILTC